VLGEGGYGVVYALTHRSSHQPVAVKVLDKRRLHATGDLHSAAAELAALRLGLEVPYTVALLQVEETPDRLYLVLEQGLQGDLAARLEQQGRLPAQEARRLFVQVLLALAGFHAQGVALRDLKPENVLLTRPADVRLCDFGLATWCGDTRSRPAQTPCGTNTYSAPEVMHTQFSSVAEARAAGYDPEQADMWSLGGLLFVMLSGRTPYAAELAAAGWDAGQLPLIVESFEQTALTQLRDRGIRARYVYLLEAAGRPFDLAARHGATSPTYAAQLTPVGLDRLAAEVDGISLDKKIVLAEKGGRVAGTSPVVAAAQERGLEVYTWTCRPENAFLVGQFRRGRAKAEFGDYAAEWRMIADAGVDGVFADQPDLVLDARAALRGPAG
jgi:serine/threonine protein kinase